MILNGKGSSNGCGLHGCSLVTLLACLNGKGSSNGCGLHGCCLIALYVCFKMVKGHLMVVHVCSLVTLLDYH